MVRKVDVSAITKRYGETVAVEDLSISVEDGEVVALLGPSGCGKTTTLRSICGLTKIDRGEIVIGGEVVAAPERDIHVPPYDRDVGMMFQTNALWPHMSVRENILYPLRKSDESFTAEEMQEKLTDVLEIVDLPGIGERSVNELSGGQQQRIALARSLVHEPEVLLMDEPLSSLDARLHRMMRAEIRAIQQRHGFTVIYVTHDQQEAMYMADRIYLMRDGRIDTEGTPTEIYNEPETAFSMRFFDPNDPIPGVIVETDGDTSTVEIVGSDVRLIMDNHGRSFSTGEECELYIRPNHVELTNGSGAGDNVLTGDVELCAFQGTDYEISVLIGDHELFATHDEPVEVGTSVSIRLDPAYIQGYPISSAVER